MAIIKISQNQSTNYAEYILDNVTDLTTALNYDDVRPGNIAYVLENKKLYILGSDKQWKEQ